MVVLNFREAEQIREIFLLEFIDTDSQYYRENIKTTFVYTDGICYRGYLWCCLKEMESISFFHALSLLEERKTPCYVLWDINSKEMIRIENYWKYPKNAVIRLNAYEIQQYLPTFPEDCYFFDDSLTWLISLTHEESKPGRRICYLTRKPHCERNSD